MKPFHQPPAEYLQFWGLRVFPFLQRDPNRFFTGSTQRNVLFQVENFVSSGANAAMIVAEKAGCGMTRIFQHLSLQAGLGDCAVEMVMARTLPRPAENVRTVWLLDQHDSHQRKLPEEFATDVAVLIGTGVRPRNAFTANVGHDPRVIELASMSLDDAFDYVSFATRMAGGHQNIFTDSAIEKLHHYSDGRIREFSKLAENSLRKSWSRQEKEVGASVIGQPSLPKRCAA